MTICPNCSHNNRVGVLICEKCGMAIFEDVFGGTRRFQVEDAPAGAVNPSGTRHLVRDATVVIHIADASTPIRVQPEAPMVLGRANTRSPRRPDIDLTAYRAFEKGVSCLHASIARNDQYLMIADLGSTNGTCVNGQRLNPHEPRMLRDGDEIRLGNLFLRVYFAAS